jgi:hypothetical protein
MTVYVIVQLKMIDRAAYDRYQARFFDVFQKIQRTASAKLDQTRATRCYHRGPNPKPRKNGTGASYG